jgi:hypothetical protein
MRRAWKMATMAIVMGCGTMIAAQSERPEQSTSTTSTAQSKPAMMVTGCVQRVEQAGVTGTSGSTATTRAGSGASEFSLTNATISTGGNASAAPGGAGSTSTTTGGASTTTGQASTTTDAAAATTDASKPAAPAGTSGSTYMLDDPSNKLAAHVGHKVEVTGTLAPSATAGASQRLEVSEVRMISADCSAK